MKIRVHVFSYIVVSQMKLSDCDMFNLLNKKLSHHQPILLQSSILFLSISLMYSNSELDIIITFVYYVFE